MEIPGIYTYRKKSENGKKNMHLFETKKTIFFKERNLLQYPEGKTHFSYYLNKIL